MQEDGTLDSILDDTRSLDMILEALCGVAQAKQQSDEVRVALAESLELLVSPRTTHQYSGDDLLQLRQFHYLAQWNTHMLDQARVEAHGPCIHVSVMPAPLNCCGVCRLQQTRVVKSCGI